MKSEKNKTVGLRINEEQRQYLERLVSEGKAKNISESIQKLINISLIKGTL